MNGAEMKKTIVKEEKGTEESNSADAHMLMCNNRSNIGAT